LKRLTARAPKPEELVVSWRDGRIKLWLTHRALCLRREQPDLFAAGDYLPLKASGPRAENVVAFARRHEGAAVVAIAPRLVARLTGDPERAALGEVWGETMLELSTSLLPGTYRDVLTDAAHNLDGQARLADLLDRFPVALLIRE
jgi:(1->4)-alpha-D-glucan 1-alpha-D-glucosylmutase